MKPMKSIWKDFASFLDRYSVLVAGFIIYGYFLLTSIDLMEHAKIKRTFLDFVMQFDSLILLWVIAFVVVQMQKYRKLANDQSAYQQKVNSEIEKRKSRLKMLDEVTALMQESITSPLTVIATSAKNVRRRLESDAEARTWVDHIDIATARLPATINEVKAYATKKIVAESELGVSPT
jgi:hypothetical protein